MYEVSHFCKVDMRPALRVLADAFVDDPLFRWLAPSSEARAVLVEVWMTLAIGRAAQRGNVFVARKPFERDLRGVALWSPPDVEIISEHERYIQCEVASTVLGVDLTGPLTQLRSAAALHPSEPHFYLRDVAVAAHCRKGGVGTSMLQLIHDRADSGGYPAYLETTRTENVEIFQRVGYEQVGESEIGEGVRFVGMVREPQRSSRRL